MTRREFPRAKRRVNCDVSVEGARYKGVVLELSPKGFFIQTTANAQIGARLWVELRLGVKDVVQVEATVANRRVTPARLATVTRGGLGCRLTAPSEAYYQYLASLNS